MGVLFLILFLAIDLGVYKYLVSNGFDQTLVNKACTGAFFIALAIQISIDWYLKKEFRTFYLVVPIDSADAKPMAILAIVGSSILGLYMLISAPLFGG
jgi:hypothetical protein